MPKLKTPKVPPIKKVMVSAGIANLTPDEKITHARTTHNTCLTSAPFTASQPCKDAMATWQTTTDNLEKNQQGKAALLVQLGVLDQQEAQCIFAYDEAADAFAAAVKTAAAGDRSIVVGMGLGPRADPVVAPDPFTPTGLKVTVLKIRKVPKLEWDAMPGAKLYVAQMSPTPANEASWVVIYGGGKSRMIPPLVPGQVYAFRVAAVGKDGKQSAWSATVTFTA